MPSWVFKVSPDAAALTGCSSVWSSALLQLSVTAGISSNEGKNIASAARGASLGTGPAPVCLTRFLTQILSSTMARTMPPPATGSWTTWCLGNVGCSTRIVSLGLCPSISLLTKIQSQSMLWRMGGGLYLTMGLFDLGNVISRTGFRSQVLHNLERKKWSSNYAN